MKLQRNGVHLVLIPALALTFSVTGHAAAGDVDNRVSTTPTNANASRSPANAAKVHQMRVSELIGMTGEPETLEGVPSFDKNRWPDLDDSKWRSDVTRYEQNWRAAPAARTSTPERAAASAGERVECSAEQAADKVDRATERTTAPAKQ